MTEPLRSMVVNEVPLWDAKVQAILVEVRSWITDREAFPIQKRDAISNLCYQLEMLAFELDNGKWPEGVLAPKQELEAWERPLWELEAERFIAYWDEQVAERLPWTKEAIR